MVTGTIFDIKRYAIHDGPGIRSTVFFKGCSLRCQWCHNPEGIEPELEIVWHSTRCVKDCRLCIPACPKEALAKRGALVVIDRERCDTCGQCQEVCVYDAVEIIGREVSVEEILEEIEKDRIFYEESNGGVTFSGGEPLEQPEFLVSLLERLKERGIHTTVDTSGHYSTDVLSQVIGKADLFLYDIKIMDDRKHKRYTGQSNEIILQNLRQLADEDCPVVVRIPLIAGVNDDDENIEKTTQYLQSLKNIKRVNLLPYHAGGSEKCRRLGKGQLLKTFSPPRKERIEEIRTVFKAHGFSVRGGD